MSLTFLKHSDFNKNILLKMEVWKNAATHAYRRMDIQPSVILVCTDYNVHLWCGNFSLDKKCKFGAFEIDICFVTFLKTN